VKLSPRETEERGIFLTKSVLGSGSVCTAGTLQTWWILGDGGLSPFGFVSQEDGQEGYRLGSLDRAVEVITSAHSPLT